ncbi:MAG: glycosyltransferase family 4 protein, partial [Ktedonobacterales bacterium]
MVSREYPPETHIGGIGTYTHKTAAALARLGHEVHVVTSAWKPAAEYLEDGVFVHRLAEPRVRPDEARALLHARHVAQALAAIAGRLDIVQACEWGGEAAWYALRPRSDAALITRLATPHFLVERLNQHSRNFVRSAVVRRMERIQTGRSDDIISPTHALARLVSAEWRIPLERIAIVPTGMDALDVGTAEGAGDEALPESLAGQRYLLYFGRLEERKGVHILADALPGVLTRYPELKAVFVGDDLPYHGGSMQAAIRARAGAVAERLIFVPRLPQADLFPIVRRAEVVVLPSLWENLANTCLEAMRFGKPVIATWGCGFEEVIEDGTSGFLVPPGDAAALADRLVAALSEPERLIQVGTAALMRVAEFHIDVMAARLAAHYERVLQDRGATLVVPPVVGVRESLPEGVK